MAKHPKKNTWHGASRKAAQQAAGKKKALAPAAPLAVQSTPAPSAPTPQLSRAHSQPRDGKDFNPAHIGEQDAYLFNEGRHLRLYDKLGAHLARIGGVDGVQFAVWAPSAEYVAVVGDFNAWDAGRNALQPQGATGIWAGFVPGVHVGTKYKYHVASRHDGYRSERADPFAFFNECPPFTASIVRDLDYEWHDKEWLAGRKERQTLQSPISIYEVHLGSWMRAPEDPSRFLTYRELAQRLTEHVNNMGFTHIEFLPLTEHPFAPSWGYQTTGYFAPSARYGTPQEFMYLIDYLHQHDIGVILDWVPSHFPNDGHALAYFDGTHLYEHADPQKGFHPDWKSCIFNYGRHEVRAFLISSALFWLDKYHVDGLRVDAVASMLYLDYSRKAGEWIPNQYGGNENLEAISFLRQFNEAVYSHYPDVQTYAEESTAWPMVSRPTYVGGLGFGFKWDMGWMHDTLKYLQHEPIHRSFHHNQLSFRMLYAWTENYILPLSHDEVVHGKGSLLARMPGDCWQQFANLRLLFGYQFGQPAKKLMFMGGEFAQGREWQHDQSLDWHQAELPPHQGVLRWVSDLNRTYRGEPALYQDDCNPNGFEWVDCNDTAASVISFLRKGHGPRDWVLVAANFTPVPRGGYRVGVPVEGFWKELLNSDATIYGGGGMGNLGGQWASHDGWHFRPYSLTLTLPPLGIVFLKLTEGN